MADGIQIYKAQALGFEPHWFPLFRLLADEGPHTVGAAATSLGLTHAAVSQQARMLTQKKLLASRKDPKDERRRVLLLSAEGQALLPKLQLVWEDIEAGIQQMVDHSGVDILTCLDGLEDAQQQRSLFQRVQAKSQARLQSAVEIIGFAPEHRAHFKRINMQWLQKQFELEPVDLEILDEPERIVLQPGGHIYFAKVEGEIVGTCALLKQGERFELTKMGVLEKARGRQIGQKLLQHAIEEAKRLGAPSLFLLTTSVLRPAVSLYRKLGFVVTHAGPHPKYKRADLTMELSL